VRKVTGTFVHPAGVSNVESVEDTLSGQGWLRVVYCGRVKYDRLPDPKAVEFYLGRHNLHLGDFEEVLPDEAL
jgi:hypothetical protein